MVEGTGGGVADTGEGLFFTSRAADHFRLSSHRIQVDWDRSRDDVFVSTRRFLRGTRVDFLVFARRHPAVKIEPENANPVIAAMLRHVGGRESTG
jgi:hypothetical protein